MRQFLEKISKSLPSITIPLDDGRPYLTRYYLLGADRKFGNSFLHHFHSSDLDRAPSGEYYLHNHPWHCSCSLILAGGYYEYRRIADNNPRIKVKKYSPGDCNFITHKDFHRVELIEKDAWSLFFTSYRSEKMSWGFWDPVSFEYKDWKNFKKAVA